MFLQEFASNCFAGKDQNVCSFGVDLYLHIYYLSFIKTLLYLQKKMELKKGFKQPLKTSINKSKACQIRKPDKWKFKDRWPYFEVWTNITQKSIQVRSSFKTGLKPTLKKIKEKTCINVKLTNQKARQIKFLKYTMHLNWKICRIFFNLFSNKKFILV